MCNLIQIRIPITTCSHTLDMNRLYVNYNTNTRHTQKIMPCNTLYESKVIKRIVNPSKFGLLAEKKDKSGISFDALNFLTGAENKPCFVYYKFICKAIA